MRRISLLSLPSQADPNTVPVAPAADCRHSYAAAGVHVLNCSVLHTVGNAIETGVYDQCTANSPEDADDPACHNGTRFCAGFWGVPGAPNTVRNDTLCNCRFGGVTVIGSNVLVEDNTITVSSKPWLSPNRSSGTTMGVSAAFVGSHSVLVTRNVIHGADCGVGSDGSYPLYTSVRLFQALWGRIYAALSPAFRARYLPSTTSCCDLRQAVAQPDSLAYPHTCTHAHHNLHLLRLPPSTCTRQLQKPMHPLPR